MTLTTLEEFTKELIESLKSSVPVLVIYDDTGFANKVKEEKNIAAEEINDIRANPQRKEEMKVKKVRFDLVWIGSGIDKYLPGKPGHVVEVWRDAYDLAAESAIIAGLVPKGHITELTLKFLLKDLAYIHELNIKEVKYGEDSFLLYIGKKPRRYGHPYLPSAILRREVTPSYIPDDVRRIVDTERFIKR